MAPRGDAERGGPAPIRAAASAPRRGARAADQGEAGMNAGDGSMTFDWILYTILVIPMVFAAWELYKNNKAMRRDRR